MKILITGAYDGIARRVGIELLKRGHQVYMTTHDELEAKWLNVKLKEKYPKLDAFKLDITNEEDRIKVNDLDLDILISHAAIGEGGSIADIPMDLVRKNFEANVFSNFELIQLVLAKMIEKKKGRIILTSSLIGLMPFKWLGVYAASKASITTLGETLIKELKELNTDIKISIIEPGAYYTGFNQLMLDNKYKWMNEKSHFKGKLKSIYKKENLKFALLEKKTLDSVVSCFIDACLNEKPKKKYKTPFLQTLMVKLYLIFIK